MKSPNQSAIEFANDPNKKVAPSLKTKAKVLLGAAAVTVGLGVTGNNDHEAQQLTDQNNEYILDQAKQTGQSAGETFIPPKDEIVPNEGQPITPGDVAAEGGMIVGNDGQKSVDAEREANNG